MKNVKKMVAAGMMMAAMFGTSLAGPGIIVAKEKPTSCSNDGTDLGGIILAGIILAKTGIILAKGGRDDCGSKNGIILAGS